MEQVGERAERRRSAWAWFGKVGYSEASGCAAVVERGGGRAEGSLHYIPNDGRYWYDAHNLSVKDVVACYD